MNTVFTSPGVSTTATGTRIADDEILADLAAHLDELVAEDAFSGTVLVARAGASIFAQAYGLASQSFGVPNHLDTTFNLGSMNKMFTAVAIARLAERGRLAFTDPIGQHLPDYPNATVAETVTIHHLLTHTSGLGDYFNDDYERTTKDRFKQIADFPSAVSRSLFEIEPRRQI